MRDSPHVVPQYAMEPGIRPNRDRAAKAESLPTRGRIAIWAAMTRRSPLDDPNIAAHAWARYKRLMRWMFAFTGVVVVGALGLVWMRVGVPSVHLFIATGLGVGLATLLMSALMGLVFLSSGTGHDESVTGEDDDQDPGGRSR
ncbi:MAG TPA: hypothetical protein VI168_15340 [Croceibacterium sp.]